MGQKYGQHFLTRPSILEAIADAAVEDLADGSSVLEIGPGRGALTDHLLARAAHVIAIEIDPVLVQYLRQKYREQIEAGKLTLIEDDILKADISGWGPLPVVGNLPYYITSPILERLFSARSWTRAVFLVQAEVAERLAANSGIVKGSKASSRDYGYLSIVAQTQASVKILLHVPRAAFRPPPKVESAVVQLLPKDTVKEYGITDLPAFLRFAGVCFRQKRKTLRNNLSAAYPKEIVDKLPESGMRAEQMSIADLVRLAGTLVKLATDERR
ncbi:MAG: 16S rRNA (adenine(1518)-N(6)/adenine(1519)-N(6))-dimethyltransferase RsmA [Acidobacteriota bacterium]